MLNPRIIQGGMGVAVSGWMLARAVSRLGQLGVVSGTALAVVLARRLQQGDPEGHLRRAISQFPYPSISDRILAEYFIEGGKAPNVPFKTIPMPTLHPRSSLVDLTVLANFVEVFLAKEGHSGVVGINYLEKIQLPTLYSLYGAMLAGVDYVLMGAGIPRAIPGVLDRLAEGLPADLPIDVADAASGEFTSSFDPVAFASGKPSPLKRPLFLAIVSSATLAIALARKSNGRVDGFVVEGPSAGGHNAPPRGPLHLSSLGEPVYGVRDVPELDKIQALGLPFWLAGSYGRPGKLAEALAQGAAGVQVGTAFAFCEESGISPELKQQALKQSRSGQARSFADPLASPAGFPFKIAPLENTLSEKSAYDTRHRVCDLGYLRRLYRKPDGTVGYRCPAEPVDVFLRKGGILEDTVGRKCICNGLPATVGLGQLRSGSTPELPLLTAGDDWASVAEFLKPGCDTYTAADVVERLLAPP
ncbi:MAG TPA: nitronate monooxygenase [Candidatus Paceibacterota bacterium]|nr:nitronate monooxygenase [Verrucomicrobiota bacterium]HRY46999.1 nitronate monooxygenase [Candidatus Paceibacterota bacterium]HRZ99101.1 nitronate monooxygenase [Candidatus Paceibacterota bacterium]